MEWFGSVLGSLVGGYNSIVRTEYEGKAFLEGAKFNRDYAMAVNDSYQFDFFKKIMIGIAFFVVILILVVFLLNNDKNRR